MGEAHMTPEVSSPPGREELLHDLYAALGSLVTAFVHNLNNYLMGVMGNIDLASLYPEDSEAVTSKLSGALNSSTRIRDFLAELVRFMPVEGNWTRESLDGVTAVAGLACGRSMTLETTGTDLLPAHLPLSDLGFRALMLGLLSWAVRSCAGAGKVRIDISVDKVHAVFHVSWESPDRPHDLSGPDSTLIPGWIAPVAVGLGITLEEGELTRSHGSVFLRIPLESI